MPAPHLNERLLDEKVELDAAGLLITKDLLDKQAFVAFTHQEDNPVESLRLRVQRKADKLHVEDVPVAPVEVDYGMAFFNYRAVGQIPRGKITVEPENHTDTSGALCVIQYPPGFAPEFLQPEPSLTGKRLLTNQTFRDLFRTETVSHDKGIGIKDITFLFTDLKGSTAMYDHIGDPKACFLVRQHFEILNSMVAKNSCMFTK